MSDEKVEEEVGTSEAGAEGAPTDAPGPAGAAGGGGETALSDAGVVLGRAVLRIARVMLKRGGRQAKRAAESGRVRLDLRQLRRDRDVMYQKLGREVRHLLEGGELDHPGIRRGVARIEELEARIAEVEAELAAQAAAEADARDTSGEAGGEEIQDEDLDEAPSSADGAGGDGDGDDGDGDDGDGDDGDAGSSSEDTDPGA